MKFSPFVPRTFVVEGLSAVAEYVRHRPELVKEVQCLPREKPAVERLLAGVKGGTIPLKLREGVASDAKRPGPGERPGQPGRPGPFGRSGRPFRRGERPTEEAGDPQSLAPVSALIQLKAWEPDVLEGRLKHRSRDLLIALDHVQDPRNLGAIVRSAAFFGVTEVLVPERRQVLLTQASVATAQGGFALTDLVCVVNLGRTLAELQKKGYWIVGAAMDGEPMTKVVGDYEKVVLVLGAEDSGLSRGVREGCDRLVAIGGAGRLDSLNVSVAAGVLRHAFGAGLRNS